MSQTQSKRPCCDVENARKRDTATRHVKAVTGGFTRSTATPQHNERDATNERMADRFTPLISMAISQRPRAQGQMATTRQQLRRLRNLPVAVGRRRGSQIDVDKLSIEQTLRAAFLKSSLGRGPNEVHTQAKSLRWNKMLTISKCNVLLVIAVITLFQFICCSDVSLFCFHVYLRCYAMQY